MNTVTISSKFQVVIPRRIREEMGLHPGEKLQVIAYRNRIELIPLKEVRRLRGAFKGMDTSFDREGDRV